MEWCLAQRVAVTEELGHECFVLQACVQERIKSTTALLEKLQQHLETVQYGDKRHDTLAQPGTLTSKNPAAAGVRTTAVPIIIKH